LLGDRLGTALSADYYANHPTREAEAKACLAALAELERARPELRELLPAARLELEIWHGVLRTDRPAAGLVYCRSRRAADHAAGPTAAGRGRASMRCATAWRSRAVPSCAPTRCRKRAAGPRPGESPPSARPCWRTSGRRWRRCTGPCCSTPCRSAAPSTRGCR